MSTDQKFNWNKFKEYVNTYPTELIDNTSNKTILLDMLYGLGVSLDDVNYRWNDGFKQFLKYLKTDIIND